MKIERNTEEREREGGKARVNSIYKNSNYFIKCRASATTALASGAGPVCARSDRVNPARASERASERTIARVFTLAQM